MRRFVISWLTAALLIGLAVAPVTARGPNCADFQSASADGNTLSNASYDPESGDVNGRFFLAARSCKNIEYTLFIVEDDGDTAVIAQQSVMGSGTDAFVIITVSDVPMTDGDVCAYVQSGRGKQVLDRAPSDGCVILLADGSSPGGGKGF